MYSRIHIRIRHPVFAICIAFVTWCIRSSPSITHMLCYRNPQSTMRLYLAGNNKLVVDSDNILRLDDLDVVIIYKTLINNTFVVSLDLRYNHITDDGAKYLGLLLAVCTVSILASGKCNRNVVLLLDTWLEDVWSN